MNQYRIWNLDTGACWESRVSAESPEDAFEKSVPQRVAHQGRRYLVAKTSGDHGGNDGEVGVFAYTRPSQPSLIVKKVVV